MIMTIFMQKWVIIINFIYTGHLKISLQSVRKKKIEATEDKSQLNM